jgi:Glycosyltransferase family 17
MATPDLMELSPPSRRPSATISRALRHRLGRIGTRLAHLTSRSRRPGGWPPAPVPQHIVSGHTATFEELERITLDPAMVARVETVPPGVLLRPDRPPPVVPAAVLALGWTRRRRPARIYDVVPFAFELDVLELRLAELHDVVDHFVVGEAARGFGGMGKPLYLQRNWSRFAPFHPQMTAVVVESDRVGQLYPTARREQTDWIGEDTLRALLWQQVRHLALEPDAVVIWSDVDELLPRWLIYLIKHYECPLPLRVRAPAFRYHFGWRDPEATAGITVIDARSVPPIDANAKAIRTLPARTFSARGAVHLTSFLDPAVLLMKCVLTTDWEPAVLPYLRNAHGEITAMMGAGTWFGRPQAPYDPERDTLGLVPEMARLNRDRFARFWPEWDAS